MLDNVYNEMRKIDCYEKLTHIYISGNYHR
ncbi:protein of unknown function [Xenorhabdus poinarii G6]|uniref:Uncharacterized protein n=1 Tax=Xenorhabdus poinarii G6 TaxID=1354304 RepID=A0A068R8G2_9GAMM|nr:protein of unknown function [Xenorhabdus poinarii G6]